MEKCFQTLKIINKNANEEIGILKQADKIYFFKKVSDESYYYNALVNEFNVLTKLQNCDYVPKIKDYNLAKNKSYMVVEYVKGCSLKKMTFNSLKERIVLMIKILDIIEYFHNHKIIHCDLKPSHIFILDDYTIKVIDFGISILEGKNNFSGYGNIKYCSPEQLLGLEISEQTDIYSLGVIFYELITGHLPFDGNSEEIKALKLSNCYKKTSDILLQAIYNKSINCKIDQRYMNIKQFKDDLLLLLKLKFR